MHFHSEYGLGGHCYLRVREFSGIFEYGLTEQFELFALNAESSYWGGRRLQKIYVHPYVHPNKTPFNTGRNAPGVDITLKTPFLRVGIYIVLRNTLFPEG